MNRKDIAALIASRLAAEHSRLAGFYRDSGLIPYFTVDEVLPEPLALAIATAFPPVTAMTHKNTLRERKYIASQMNRYDPILEEVLYAFQEPEVVAEVKKIVQHSSLHPDPMLYAGGISRMEKGCYLNPHIDNSHDKDRKHWRALNLLYYVSPQWQIANGGNLEVWPQGPKDAPVTITSQFNRLVVMATHHRSWHSVSPIKVAKSRMCVSNYYFSDQPVHPEQKFHVTSFRGRPEQCMRDMVLRGDALLRMALRKIKQSGFFNTGHWYTK